MKLACAIGVILAASALAGCMPLTLEEAKAECDKQGGLLVVLYTQKVNRDYTLAPAVAHPGHCVSRDEFHQQPPAGAPASGAPVPPAN